MWCGAISCLITVFSAFAHLTLEGVIQRKYLLLAHKARNKGMVWNNVRYEKKISILVHHGYGPQEVQKWAKTPQNYIVHAMLVPVVSYFISYPAFICLQYHPMPQTCVYRDRHAKAYL